MPRSGLLLAAAVSLSLVACAQQQPSSPGSSSRAPTNSPQDLAYCAKLSELYQRYVGPDPNSANMAGVRPDVEGGVAVAKCREGDARASIPTLERLLKDADITLPPRG